jgi:hypothetical protein
MLALFLLIALAVVLVPSHLLSLALYKKLVTNGNKYPMLIRASVFLLSAVIIAFVLCLIVIYNVPFGR